VLAALLDLFLSGFPPQGVQDIELLVQPLGATRALYRLSGPVAEFSNLGLKAKLGLRQFCVRGLRKVRCEVLWDCLTYNIQQRWVAMEIASTGRLTHRPKSLWSLLFALCSPPGFCCAIKNRGVSEERDFALPAFSQSTTSNRQPPIKT
jgi:hypothetical protein